MDISLDSAPSWPSPDLAQSRRALKEGAILLRPAVPFSRDTINEQQRGG